ncbi:hypothetical protein TNCV_2512761 [Trichonephila clavipes]|nr:hypothetical protein TNCV_2512761 [Trichonephila clavipes]
MFQCLSPTALTLMMLGVTGKRNAKRSSIPYLDWVCGLMWVGLPGEGDVLIGWSNVAGRRGYRNWIFLHTVSAVKSWIV